jgi:hypothetical protein
MARTSTGALALNQSMSLKKMNAGFKPAFRMSQEVNRGIETATVGHTKVSHFTPKVK